MFIIEKITFLQTTNQLKSEGMQLCMDGWAYLISNNNPTDNQSEIHE